ncbi:MAG: hypothetical protein IID37_01175 [Planctomycetes bacterium]|nr:hypothetical protein [Planctomycetota bacterium]
MTFHLALRRARPPGWNAILLAVFMAAVVVRAAWLIRQTWQTGDLSSLTFDDERWYWRMAESLHRGDGLVGEFGHRAARMPLYPAALSLVAGSAHGIAWVKIGQVFVGALAAVFAAVLARDVAHSTIAPDHAIDADGPARATNMTLVAGLAAGMLVALDPLLVGVTSLLLTETLLIAELSAIWYVGWQITGFSQPRAAATHREQPATTAGRHSSNVHWMAITALTVATVYTRPSSLAPLVGLFVFLLIHRRFELSVAVRTLGVVLVLILSLTPWAWRNQRLTGDRCWLTHRAGISLYDGVGPHATGASDLADIKNAPAVRGLGEAEWNAYFRDQAYRSIREDPARIIGLAWIKMQRMWSPFLHTNEYQASVVRIVVAGWTLLLYAFALLGAWAMRHRWSAVAFLLMPAICLSALHSVFVGSVRYRLGALPMLAVLAAIGLATLWQRRTTPSRPSAEQST